MLEFIFNNIITVSIGTLSLLILILVKYQRYKNYNEQDPQKAWEKTSTMVRTYAQSYYQEGKKFPEKTPIKIPKILEPYNIKYNPETGELIKPKNL